MFTLQTYATVVIGSSEPRGPSKNRRQYQCSRRPSFRSLRKSVASSCRRRYVKKAY